MTAILTSVHGHPPNPTPNVDLAKVHEGLVQIPVLTGPQAGALAEPAGR